MRNYKLERNLEKYINNPRDSTINFNLACDYFEIKQYASSLSYYLRCAELAVDQDLLYESLLCSWNCMAQVGGRPVFERGQILQAVSHSPHRPEAYNALCVWLEFCGDARIPSKEEKYLMMYSYACIGISNILSDKKLKYYNRYDGYFAFLYYKALAGWYIGKKEESEDLFVELAKRSDDKDILLDDRYKISINDTITNLGLQPRIEEK
tara:strand:- start:3623 stop:4249 length:627 start_codon:yes stop_codon:yes gene_type:complete